MYDIKFYLFYLTLFFGLANVRNAEGQVKPEPKLYLKSGTIIPEKNISADLNKSGLRTAAPRQNRWLLSSSKYYPTNQEGKS